MLPIRGLKTDTLPAWGLLYLLSLLTFHQPLKNHNKTKQKLWNFSSSHTLSNQNTPPAPSSFPHRIEPEIEMTRKYSKKHEQKEKEELTLTTTFHHFI
jgi:hypothetical protein